MSLASFRISAGWSGNVTVTIGVRHKSRVCSHTPKLDVISRNIAPVHDDALVLLIDVAGQEVEDDVAKKDAHDDAVRHDKK